MSSLLFALDGFKARPTIDIDLLGERISNDGVHRTVTVRRDSVTSVTRFFPVFTCQQNKGKHPLRMLALCLLMEYSTFEFAHYDFRTIVLCATCMESQPTMGNNWIDKSTNHGIIFPQITE